MALISIRSLVQRMATVAIFFTGAMLFTPTLGALGAGVALSPPLPEKSSEPASLTPFNGWLYFRAWRDDIGAELWRSDGTTTKLVADINPSGDAYPDNLMVVGEWLYFVANDGLSGRELWRTDGTSSGTTRVSNTTLDLDVQTIFADQIYFTHRTPNANYNSRHIQLWRMDPNSGNSILVKDFFKHGSLSQFEVVNNLLYFAFDQAPIGPGLPERWYTDGTTSWRLQGPSVSSEGTFINFRGTPFYTDSFSVSSCNFPLNRWNDGSGVGTRFSAPVTGLSGNRGINDAIHVGTLNDLLILSGELYTVGSACNGSKSLLSTDGATITRIREADGILVQGFQYLYGAAVLDGYLYFGASPGPGSDNFELWRTNGTTLYMVREIGPLTSGSFPTGLTSFNGWIYFTADDGSTGYELWRTNGYTTELVEDINRTSLATGRTLESYPYEMVPLGEWLYFSADDEVHGRELWRTNGSTTELVADLNFTKTSQAITFPNIPSRTTAQSLVFEVTATASSGLPVTLTAEGDCEVTGFTVTARVGSCELLASQSGNEFVLAAPEVTRWFAVMKQEQTISFGSVSDRTTLQPSTFAVSGTASSGLPVEFSATGACNVSGDSVSVQVGICTLTARQGGDGSYLPALAVVRSFVISKAAQSISFGALTGRTVLAAPATLSATASSGLTIVFDSATPEVCSVSGATVSVVDIGTCTVVATQVGDSMFLAAPPISRSFVITRVLLTNKTVRFTGPDGTTPIVGAAVTWSSRDGAYQSTSTATTNSSGNIVFKSIPGGAIDFAVSGAVIGDWSGYQEVSGFVGSAATTVRLVSNSYSAFTTTLTVQMPDGTPVVGVEVVLRRSHVSGSFEARFCRPFQRVEWLLRDCKYQGVTDAFGRVTFRIIPTTLNTDCCGEGKRTWAEVVISDADLSYTAEVEMFDNVASASIEIEQLPVVDILAEDATVGYAAPRTITAVARDSSGDPIAGQALTLSASVSGASASCSGKKTTSTTGSTGVATFKVCPVKTAIWSVDGASIVGSSGVTLTVQTTPTAPRSLTSTGKTKSVALAWAAPASVNIGAVTDYIVQYRLQGSSTWITFRDGTSTARKATVTGLIKGRVYEFRIAAKNKAGTGTWSVTVLRAAK